MSFIQQGLTSSGQFIKLDPTIPDLSIPELLSRVNLEERQGQSCKGNEHSAIYLISAYTFLVTVKHAKTQRTLGCGICTGCTSSIDCGKCRMCLDKPKFGGPGKRKQRCMLIKEVSKPSYQATYGSPNYYKPASGSTISDMCLYVFKASL